MGSRVWGIWGLLACLALLACQRRRMPDSAPSLGPLSEKSTSFRLFSAEEARILLGDVKVTPSVFGAQLKAPTLSLEFSQADFARVLRCSADAYQVYETAAANSAALSLEDRRWVWVDAFGDPRCQVVSMGLRSSEFDDLACPRGDWFYLLNPCVSRERSEDGREACSFELAISKTFHSLSDLGDEFRSKLSQLVAAESRHEAAISRLANLVFQLNAEKQACQVEYESKIGAYHRAELDQAYDDSVNLGASLGAGIAAGLLGGLGMRYALRKKGQFTKTVAPILTGGILFGAAAGIPSAIILGSRQAGVAPDKVCPKVQALAKELLNYQGSKVVELALEELVRLSLELSKLDSRFRGYDQSLLAAMSQRDTL